MIRSGDRIPMGTLHSRLVQPMPDTVYNDYSDDVARLVRAARAAGYLVTPIDAFVAWRGYSEMYDAGWLGMDRMPDDELVKVLTRLLLTEPLTPGLESDGEDT